MARLEGGRPDPGSELLGAGPEAEFRAHLQAGRFMIQRSRSTGEHVFYPRVAAPGGEQDLEWVEASGDGTVYAMTVNRSRDGAYNSALVDLAEGPRLMSRIEGRLMSRIEGVESLPIGAAVRARASPARQRSRPSCSIRWADSVAHPLRGRVAIAGIGTAGIGEAPGWSATKLMGKAALAAIADAGLLPRDIDDLFAATSTHAFPTLTMAEFLGLRLLGSAAAVQAGPR